MATFVAFMILDVRSDSGTMRNDSERIFDLLVSTPRWETIDRDDKIDQTKLDAAFVKISTFETKDIRAAIVRYRDLYLNGLKPGAQPEAKPLSIFNLVVLNRFIFAVPEHPSEEKLKQIPFYLSMPAPRNDGIADLLWPVTIAANGRPMLTGDFYTNSGPLPDPVREFEIFDAVFGRRKLN